VLVRLLKLERRLEHSPASPTTASAAIASTASQMTLVVYSAQGYDSAMTKAFTAATGIPVKLDDNSTGPHLHPAGHPVRGPVHRSGRRVRCPGT
jgi:hypothetical protein